MLISRKEDRKVIGVIPAAELAKRQRLFSAVSSLFPVEFRGTSYAQAEECDGLLIWSTKNDSFTSKLDVTRPGFVVCGESDRKQLHTSTAVTFGNSLILDPGLRGLELTDESLVEMCEIRPVEQDEILGSIRGQAVWTHRKCLEQGIDFVAVDLPELGPEQLLYEYFEPRNFFRLLPFFCFLRRICFPAGWDRQPLRANFMFDDPNLHSRRYGFVHFPRMVQEAKTCGYHVSFATVPLDSVWFSRHAAAVFAQNPRQISLLIHGNNHTTLELFRPEHQEECLKIAAQAMQRILQFEKKSGIEVSRVMAAPHGACSEKMMDSMLITGFEAACISRGALMHYNPDKKWRLTTGLEIAEFMGQGFPVIPRFGMGSSAIVDIVLAALLDQPIIPVGHHQDLAARPDLLQKLAAVINRFENIEWMSLKEIARSNYRIRSEGSVLRIRMYSRRVRVHVTGDIEELQIERPWIEDGKQEDLSVISDGGIVEGAARRREANACSVSASGHSGWIEIVSWPDQQDLKAAADRPRLGVWPIVRKGLCELRDRAWPIFKP